MLSQSLKYQSQMHSMLRLILGINQNIINEYNHKSIQKWPEHSIHQVCKGCWGISQPKGHYQKLVMAISGLKCCFRHITTPDSQLMIFGSQINLREMLDSLQLVKQVINPGKRILVLDGNLIQLSVINT